MKTFVLIGPESTGKSWLSKLLAEHFNTTWLPEYLREYYDEHKGISEAEMETVAKKQIQSENEIFQQNVPFVFLDTNIITLKVYYEYYYKSKPTWFNELYDSKRYFHYLLLDTSVEWIADEQRDSPEVRKILYHQIKTELESLQVSFNIITGDYSQRFKTAKKIITTKIK